MNRTDELRTARIESTLVTQPNLRYGILFRLASPAMSPTPAAELKKLNGEDKRLLVITTMLDPRSHRCNGVRHPSAVAAQPVPVTAGNRNAHLF